MSSVKRVLRTAGSCPVFVTSKFWRDLSVSEVHDQMCVACRFKRCSEVMGMPRNFYEKLNKIKLPPMKKSKKLSYYMMLGV